jgi:hypothetical protein
MQKFIVTIDCGSEPCSCEYHVAVECDSIEELYSGLMDAAKARVKFRKEREQPQYNNKDDSWLSLYEAWKQEDKASQYPIICGTTFDIDALIYFKTDYDKGKSKTTITINEQPDIQTFDQWFEEHKHTVTQSIYWEYNHGNNG